MERNLLLVLRFEGTRYHGFQVQKNALCVCEVFQDAVERVLGVRYGVKGCSRTDAGVHAANYCVSMKINGDIPCEKLPLALNMYLPEDIAVLSCKDMPEDFHARYSAVGKEYVYNLHNSHIRDPFSANFCYRMGYPLDAELLEREARGFLGTHDFAAFQAKGGDVADTTRTVTGFTAARKGENIRFSVTGDGFLYKMVRIMIGTLLHIGTGKLPEGCIPDIIRSRDRARAGKTAPARGLILNRVFYED